MYQAAVDAALAEMAENRVIHRIWAHDHTVWKPEPMDITNRLGWLHTAEVMLENVPRLEELAKAIRAKGYTQALLLGMGGSSLAPEVFRKTFGVKEGYLDLAVLDSTDPGAVLAHAERLDPVRTLFIVATKSGTTVETLSFFKFFYNRVAEAVGADRAGEHFIAITDPGSKLADLAERYGFRATFLNAPNIGGRYSALSYFGLVPAVLVGVDVPRLLDRALAVASGCESCVAAGDNLGAWLGAILGELAKAGRDKVTFAISPAIASFGDWVEQLIAESTGKEGRGILPVVGEPLGSPEVYGNDRLFVYLRLDGSAGLTTGGDETHDAALAALEAAGGTPEPARSLRPGRAVVPVGDGHRRGRPPSGYQPLRPAQRRGGQSAGAPDGGRVHGKGRTPQQRIGSAHRRSVERLPGPGPTGRSFDSPSTLRRSLS
jgi:glucose-6-phosphate isomerase